MSKRIAITGGIGSGKSYVLQKIAARGFATFSCDTIYKTVIDDPVYIQQVSQLFPRAIEDGRIHRKKLADIVFGNEKARKSLNQLAHPFIMSRLYEAIDKASGNASFAEVPLLFETGYEKDFDAIIVVKRKQEERIRAVAQRDGLTETEIQNRIRAQKNWELDEEYKGDCIYVLHNDTNEQDFNNQLENILITIMKS